MTNADVSPPASGRFVSHASGAPIEVTIDGGTLFIGAVNNPSRSRWRLHDGPDGTTLQPPPAGTFPASHGWSALEAATVLAPHRARLRLADAEGWAAPLFADGTLSTAALWQQPARWMVSPAEPFAQHFTMTQGRRHPVRPPKPVGTVYRRGIPWLGRTLSFRAVEPDRDLATFHRWMNDPVVDRFWQEAGDLARHRAYLDTIAADPHVVGLVGAFDGEDFGYFEVYWAKEDRIAPHCEAGDHDRGWHVLVGEPRFRGRPWISAWMPSISHCLFLDDCRTQRIVIEPRADNHPMARSLARSGYAHLKYFDFPHKRALLATLSRDRFFGEALWIPASDEPGRPA